MFITALFLIVLNQKQPKRPSADKMGYYSAIKKKNGVRVHEAQNNYDKDSITYSCAAEATLTSKPGKAYLLNSWDYDDATRTIKCNVDYRTFFCKNGYTTCVGLNDIYGCKYKDDK